MIFSIPAFAGFEWTPPPEKEPVVKRQIIIKPSAHPANKSEVAVDNNKEPTPLLTPVPSSAPATAPAHKTAVSKPVSPRPPSQPVVARAPVQNQDFDDPLVINPYPTGRHAGAPVAAKTAPESVSNQSGVDGFGSDISFIIALRQIVPPSYSFSISSAAQAKIGKKVSWSGDGRPWSVVGSEMASSIGLSFNVIENVVVIDAI